MKKAFKIAVTTIGVLLLTAGSAWAGTVVYEKVDLFNHSVHFTDEFMIDTKGIYQATLTDFQFPNAFKTSGLNVTTSENSLGKLLGPGAFTFEAGPGDYFVSMFAEAGGSQLYAEEKRRLIDEEKQRRKEISSARWNNLTKEEQSAKQDLWKSRSKAEREERRERRENALNKWAEEKLATINIGQYGIEISMIEGALPSDSAASSVVPLPATAWLFGSGLISLIGFAKRKAA